jgi:hypothetical protein
MVSENLLTYIKGCLTQGLTLTDVRNALALEGWQATYVEEALSAVKNDQAFASYFQEAKPEGGLKKLARSSALKALVLILVFGGLGYGLYTFVESRKTSPSPAGSSAPVPTAVPLTEGLTNHTDAGENYSFNYKKEWSLKSYGTLTGLASPETATNNPSKGLGYGDILISTVPYASSTKDAKTGSHQEQAMALAKQLTGTNPLTPLTVAGQAPNAALSSSGDDATLTLGIEGKSQMFLIQFPGVRSLTDLKPEETAVLNSFTILK